MVVMVMYDDGEEMIDLDRLCLFGDEQLRECDSETLEQKYGKGKNNA